MKFEIGEIAIVNCPGTWCHNKEALIVAKNSRSKRFNSLDPNDYRTGLMYEVEIDGSRESRDYPGRFIAFFADELRKKRPPEQPSAFSYDEIISMCNYDIRPTETQVREGLKGILQPFAGLEKVGENK